MLYSAASTESVTLFLDQESWTTFFLLWLMPTSQTKHTTKRRSHMKMSRSKNYYAQPFFRSRLFMTSIPPLLRTQNLAFTNHSAPTRTYPPDFSTSTSHIFLLSVRVLLQIKLDPFLLFTHALVFIHLGFLHWSALYCVYLSLACLHLEFVLGGRLRLKQELRKWPKEEKRGMDLPALCCGWWNLVAHGVALHGMA